MPTPIIGALPVILTNGTIADATQVMADFNYILAQVNTNGAPATGGLYLPLTGGTLTGLLTIAPTVGGATFVLDGSAANRAVQGRTNNVLRWNLALGDNATETGTGNAGSDFNLRRYNDAGTIIDSPLTISRANGMITITAGNNSGITLNNVASQNRSVLATTSGLARWRMDFANNSPETGSNVGSDFGLFRFNDAGTQIDQPLTIARSTGQAIFTAPLQVNGGAAAVSIGVISTGAATSLTLDAPAATSRQILYRTAGLTRWQIFTNNAAESGANVGSDLIINAFNDAGGQLTPIPVSIKRSTSVVTFGVAIVNGPSDRSLKENIAPLEGSLDKVLALQGVSFNMKASPDKPEIGLIAQDVQPIIPEVIQDFANPDGEGQKLLAIDYPKLVAVLIESIKQLTARVASLEAKVQTT